MGLVCVKCTSKALSNSLPILRDTRTIDHIDYEHPLGVHAGNSPGQRPKSANRKLQAVFSREVHKGRTPRWHTGRCMGLRVIQRSLDDVAEGNPQGVRPIRMEAVSHFQQPQSVDCVMRKRVAKMCSTVPQWVTRNTACIAPLESISHSVAWHHRHSGVCNRENKGWQIKIKIQGILPRDRYCSIAAGICKDEAVGPAWRNSRGPAAEEEIWIRVEVSYQPPNGHVYNSGPRKCSWIAVQFCG